MADRRPNLTAMTWHAAVVLAAATIAMSLLPPDPAIAQAGEGGPAPTSVAATTALVDNAKKIALPGELPGVASAPWDLTVTPTAVWVLGARSSEVLRIDPKTDRVVKRIKLPAPGCLPRLCPGIDRIVGDARDVWVVNNGAGSLVHIDARRNKVVGTVPIKAGVEAPPVIDSTGVWVNTDFSTGDIVHIDARTHEIGKTAHVGAAPVWPIAVVDGTLWASGVTLGAFQQGVANPLGETLYRIDPATATVAGTVPGMSGQGEVVGDDLWLNRTCCPLVTLIDGHTGTPELDVNVDGGSIFEAAGGGSVWVRLFNRDASQHWVAEVDSADGTLTRFELPTTERTGGLGYGHQSLWVTNWNENAIYRMKVPVR